MQECYECGELGHRRSDCPRRARLAARRSSGEADKLSDGAQGVVDTVQNIFKSLHSGFNISEQEKESVRCVGGSDVYGELLPHATVQLLEDMKLDDKDVFVDLGCGTGKILILAALCSDVGRSVGFELSETRVQCAQEAIVQAGVQKRCVAYAENFVTTPLLEDATVCYSCNYTLPDVTMVELFERFSLLPKLRLIATFRNPFVTLPKGVSEAFARDFRAAGTLHLDCTWARGVKVFLYRRRT